MKPGSPLPLLDIEEAWERDATRRGFDRMYLQLAECERGELALRAEAARGGVRRRAVTTTVNLVQERLADRGSPVRGRPFFNDGVGRAAHTRLGLDADDPPTDVLFQQARLWTFLPYRRGFAQLAEATGAREHTVHAYLRVLLTWARAWLPLTSCTAHEATHGRVPVALPHVAAVDLEALLRPHIVGPPMAAAAGAQQLLQGVRDAVVRMRAEPGMPLVSAYNFVRPLANEQLGGALGRIRVAAGDLALLDTELCGLLSGGWARRDEAERAAFLARRPALRALFRQIGEAE
jgi:hypothetical protein